uniref:uncharacterized protein LOC120346749 n=1 Tax=Styela clava TaxID=7725 RepID=UPI00193A0535|nr:uncharacterized protein LOC120346749 [Styela clava]
MLTLKNITFISLLMLAISIEINQAKECKIPENNEDIDWDKVKDDWYMVLHTNDEVMKRDVIGVRLRNISNTNEGMGMVITELHENSPPQTFTIESSKRRDGVYYGKKSEDDALFNGDILALCDEKNYLVYAFCSLSDEWVVWAEFPTLNPTIHQISLMWNKLIEKGIIVQLYPSKTVEHPELMEV